MSDSSNVRDQEIREQREIVRAELREELREVKEKRREPFHENRRPS